jgi:FKBP-type peptidyl-prolyl cis-trans isomerase SlpA|tara:strand:+ start:1465 stop:1911 length:447 start_codon:yes stop_codon:yes gene_type:complete
MKKIIKFNSIISLHYSISNTNDFEFESTFNKNPIKFKIGDGTIPQKLEIPLYGLEEGVEQTLMLEPQDAFGIRDAKRSKTISKSLFPNQDMIKLNNIIEVDAKEKNDKTNTTFAMIKKINNDDVVLDLNHPLSGITIKFKVKVIKIYE